MPPDFISLNAAVLRKKRSAGSRGYDVRRSLSGADYVYGLGKSASKYKLAKAIQTVEYSDYIETTKTNYTAQIRLMAAFIAFEAYARLRRQKWHELAARTAPKFAAEAIKVRKLLGAKPLKELANFMNSQTLQQRIQDFSSGADVEVFAVANALRNGFAHGLYGSRKSFTPAAKVLRDALLDSIESDIADELRNLT